MHDVDDRAYGYQMYDNDTIVIRPIRDFRGPEGFLGKALALKEARAAMPG